MSSTPNPVRVASMFAGIGGICQAFKDAGAQIVWANERDKHACLTYRHNFGGSYLTEQDINAVSLDTVPDFDILTAGFPCQSFSIAGYRKGFADERGNLFFNILDVLKTKRPQAFLLENVKNLVNHDNGNTFNRIQSELESLGYTTQSSILNAMEHGNLPQTRERIFIVGFKDHQRAQAFTFPQTIPLQTTIADLIDFSQKQDNRYYYAPTHPYYDTLDCALTNPTIYQWRRTYVRENKSNACPTLTANMGTGGNNVPIIRDAHGIRKLTPQETLRFQGFPTSFTFPDSVCESQRYKQVGNSVPVPVVHRIATHILEALS